MRNGGELRIWRPIPGYEGYFIISDQGDIRAKNRFVKTLKGTVLYKGGLQQRSQVVSLNKEGRSLELLLHNSTPPLNNRPTDEVVLHAFKGPPLNDRFKIKHLDGDPNNYALSNLVWTTPRNKLTKEIIVPEPGPEPERPPPPQTQFIEEPIEGWINRYLARFPVPEDEPSEYIEWPEDDYLSLVIRYDADILAQNNRILKLRQRLREFHEEMRQLEDELNYQIDLLESGFRYQLELLEGEFEFQLHYQESGLLYRIQQLEDQVAALKAPPPRVSQPRLRLTDSAAKSLSKIPRERLTNGIQILFDKSA